MRRYKSEKVGDFKMGVMDVIKYNGRPDVFAWKYPGEELGTWSQLVVNQSQEAVLVKGEVWQMCSDPERIRWIQRIFRF